MMALILVALRELRARKGRTALSCLSLIVGILAITVVDGISTVAREYIVKRAEMTEGRRGSAVVTVPASAAAVTAVGSLLRFDTAGMASLAMVSATGVQLRTSGRMIPLVGYEGDLRQVRPFRMISGRWPSVGSHPVPEVFVNEPTGVAVGSLVPLCEAPGACLSTARVVGIVQDGEPEGRGYAGWPDLRVRAGASAESDIKVFARGERGQPDAGAAWLTDVTARFGIPIAEPPRKIDSTQGLMDLLQVMRMAFFMVGLVTLLVGVLGVLNIGLSTLRERAEELALRRSLGATPGDIAALVLIEVIVIGLLSSTVSVVIPVLGYYPAVRLALGDAVDVHLPIGAILVGVTAGLVAGLLGGLIPAVRAARMSIASVMRA